MKKLTVSKGKAMFCLIMMCLFLSQACRKEILTPTKGSNNTLTINEAKSYFDSHIGTSKNTIEKLMSNGSSSSGNTQESLFENKQAIWDGAYQKMISTGSAVKVPIDFGDIKVMVNKRTKATIQLSSLNYLLMYKDSLQTIHAEWVYLHPDSTWLYGDRNQYTGKIIIKDWNGNILRGFIYEKNKQPYRWVQGSRNSLKSSSISSLKGNTSTNNGSQAQDSVCFDLSYYQAARCPCRGHTYAERDNCTCETKPRNGVELVVKIFCPPTPECPLCDTPSPGGGGNNNGGTEPNPGNGNPGGGSPNPNDYPPQPCNPDPNYVPIRYPDGSMSIPPCIPIPHDPPPLPVSYSLNATQLVQATNITISAIRVIEEQFLIENIFTEAEVNIISEILIEQYSKDYFNNVSKFNSILSAPSIDGDDPFWNFIKNRLRIFLGIDRPETLEDRYQLETELRNLKIVATRIKDTHEALNTIYSIIPGYTLIDAMMINDGYSGAIGDTAIDIFGGSLFKVVTKPLFKIGEKYTVKMFDLGLKYPNITSKLRSFNISEFIIIKRSNMEKVIVVGEKMDERILPAKDLFKKIFKNAETFDGTDEAKLELIHLKQTLGRNLTSDELKSTLMYLQNKNWIKAKLLEGYNVIDIGPNMTNSIKSPFYIMERSFIYAK